MKALSGLAMALLLMLITPEPSRADPQADVKWIIESQIAAFRRGDFDTAYVYAAPDLKAQFSSANQFAEDVRWRLPMVWDPQEMRFLNQRSTTSGLSQMATMVDRHGDRYLVNYQMVNLGGYWRVLRIEVLYVENGLN